MDKISRTKSRRRLIIISAIAAVFIGGILEFVGGVILA